MGRFSNRPFPYLFQNNIKMEDYTLLHRLNIFVHVISGALALALGIIALATKKGGKAHKKSGWIFLFVIAFVITTGLLGVFAFKGNEFLLVITMLSAYPAFSGYRVLLTKSNKPKLIDICAAIIALSSGLYFLYYFESIGMIWNPVIIYSTVGALFLITSYDFLRYLIPAERYKRVWLYEHIYKMTASFTALLSAFVGTVFPQYHPYSQFLPSVFGTLLTIAFIYSWYRKSVKSSKSLL